MCMWVCVPVCVCMCLYLWCKWSASSCSQAYFTSGITAEISATYCHRLPHSPFSTSYLALVTMAVAGGGRGRATSTELKRKLYFNWQQKAICLITTNTSVIKCRPRGNERPQWHNIIASCPLYLPLSLSHSLFWLAKNRTVFSLSCLPKSNTKAQKGQQLQNQREECWGGDKEDKAGHAI